MVRRQTLFMVYVFRLFQQLRALVVVEIVTHAVNQLTCHLLTIVYDGHVIEKQFCVTSGVEGLALDRKILLISNHNADRRARNGVCFEFADVVARLEASTLLAPAVCQGLGATALIEPFRSGRGSLRAVVKEFDLTMRGGAIAPVTIDEDHDVCFFVGQFLRDLINLRRVHGWRARSKFAAAFIVETWTGSLKRHRSELAVLDQFDHVFVMNADAVPVLQRHTRTPVSVMNTATDCLNACPDTADVQRVVDVACIGRRVDAVHDRLLDLARDHGLFYVFDIWGGGRAIDWHEARAANAGLLQRSRYSIVWDPATTKKKSAVMQADRSLSTRYFESAASGAILLGSRSAAPAFTEHFDWPDAVIDIAPDGSDLEASLDELERDPERCAAIRRANVVNCLRRHDWVHRWEQVLAVAGLAPTPAHCARLDALEARARGIETPRRLPMQRPRRRASVHLPMAAPAEAGAAIGIAGE
jgi:hypothetical protein